MIDLGRVETVCQALDDRLGPQEWTLHGPGLYGLYSVYDSNENRVHNGVKEEARFIARARTWLPALVAELTQAREELAAVDEGLGDFYAPVLDPETEEPCGSFWKDHGVWVMRDALELAQVEVERLRAFVPSPELMQRLAALDEGYARCVDEAYSEEASANDQSR